MKNYLNILIDALHKKETLLDQISLITEQQEKYIMSEDFSLEDYNDLMVKKGTLINDMNKLDDGFAAVYARISPKLREDPLSYAEEIRTLKSMISKVSDRTALIQARELRIRNMIERMQNAERPAKGSYTLSKSDAAGKYKKVMDRTVVTPRSIFMDKKN